MYGAKNYNNGQGNNPKNYEDKFDIASYEWRSTTDLESYAKNLKNYLARLLQDEPFPAALFEKLEERLNGIRSILQKRCQVKTGGDLESLRQKKRNWLENLDLPGDSSTSVSTQEPAPPKKRPFVRSTVYPNEPKFEFNVTEKEEGTGV
jgi:hypothetical protein